MLYYPAHIQPFDTHKMRSPKAPLFHSRCLLLTEIVGAGGGSHSAIAADVAFVVLYE